MIKQFKPLILFFAFLALVFSSCKKDGVFDVTDTKSISQIELKSLVAQVKLWHDSTVSSIIKSRNQNGLKAFSVNENDIVPPIVDWEKAFINFDSSNVKSVTIPISINYKNGEHMQLVATKSKNKLNGYFIKVTPDSAYLADQIDVYNYTNFSGSVQIYNLMGVRLKKEIFKTGIAFKSNTPKNTLATITAYQIAPPCQECTLETVIVSNNRKFKTGNDYTLSYIHVGYNQNIQLDDFDGGGEVIAGGEQEYEEEGEDYDDGTEQKSDGRNTSIPNEIILSNGNIVKIKFKNTKDGVSSNQQINVRTLECLKSALEIINASSQKIKSILITATTNGHPYFKNDGTPKFSDHHSGAAIDIGAINNIGINGVSDLTLSFQSALNTNPNIRENFGPGSGNSYKFGKIINDIPGHNTHLHFSIIIPQ